MSLSRYFRHLTVIFKEFQLKSPENQFILRKNRLSV